MSIETLYQQRPPQAASQSFAELSVVAVLHAVQTDNGGVVPAGTEGTIVAVYDGGAAYEVEFIEPVGIATVRADALCAA